MSNFVSGGQVSQNQDEAPWLVAVVELRENNVVIRSSGVIVAHNWVLTAGHVVSDYETDKQVPTKNLRISSNGLKLKNTANETSYYRY